MLRFDPFRELERINQEARRRPTPSVLAFDAVRDDEMVTIYLDVPGVDADDIDVNIERNELTISVERRWGGEDKEILASERPQGTFVRRIMLSDGLDTEAMEADLDSGVLKITVPMSERTKPRKIDVQSSSGSETIDVDGEDQ
ncbi:MAG TPA: Hsp20/alpha crystallin family protein [Acidimicrobiia bacterium]|nr:Hsp20/alpha crystallin family protein [Acidimicrobiia bacterium]